MRGTKSLSGLLFGGTWRLGWFFFLEDVMLLAGARQHTYFDLGHTHKETNGEDKVCGCQDRLVLSCDSVLVQSMHFKQYNIQPQIKRQRVFSV